MPLNTVKFSEFAAGSLANANYRVGVTSLSGGTNWQMPDINSWTTAGRPVTPVTGTLGYNTDLSQYEFWNGAAWVQLAAGGSGTVGLGGAGQIAYYASSGTAVAGTNTIPNTVATQGIVNGSAASAGIVGEVISSQVLFGSSISLTTGVPADITFITLTAGQWSVDSNAFVNFTGNAVSWLAGTSTVSGSFGDPSTRTELNNNAPSGIASGGGNYGVTCPTFNINVGVSTNIYLNCQAAFMTGSALACGQIQALRVR